MAWQWVPSGGHKREEASVGRYDNRREAGSCLYVWAGVLYESIHSAFVMAVSKGTYSSSSALVARHLMRWSANSKEAASIASARGRASTMSSLDTAG